MKDSQEISQIQTQTGQMCLTSYKNILLQDAKLKMFLDQLKQDTLETELLYCKVLTQTFVMQKPFIITYSMLDTRKHALKDVYFTVQYNSAARKCFLDLNFNTISMI